MADCGFSSDAVAAEPWGLQATELRGQDEAGQWTTEWTVESGKSGRLPVPTEVGCGLRKRQGTPLLPGPEPWCLSLLKRGLSFWDFRFLLTS